MQRAVLRVAEEQRPMCCRHALRAGVERLVIDSKTLGSRMDDELVEHQQGIALVVDEQRICAVGSEQLLAVQTAAAVLRGLQHRGQELRSLEALRRCHQREERA